MNKHILTLATVLTLVLFGGGCDYNEDNFEGLQDGTVATDVKRFDYTLTDEDYTAIANNKTNKSIAADAGAAAALKAIGTNKYFATPADAATYIPAYLAANYATLDNTSAASVTYTYALDLPENVAAMNAMKEIKNLDYTKIWGEGTENEYLTPATVDKLTDALPTEGLEAGDYVAVTYKYAETEPTVSEPDPVVPAKPEFTSVLGTAALDAAVEVTGYISALSSQGPILTDKGGSVLLYGNKATSHLKLGEIVKVSGTIAQYNNGFQIAADKATIEQTEQTETVTYPTPTELDGAAMDGILETYYDEYHYAQFVKVKGTVSISGNFYNFNVAGATAATGSFYGITDEIKGKVEDGKEVTLYGYFTSVSKSGNPKVPKFVNIIVTHVDETPATVKPATLALNTRAEVATEKRYAVYQWDGSKFTATKNAVLQPADYTAMGQKYGNFTDPDQNIYLPQYLAANYPYGKADDVKYVSYLRYKSGATSWATDEYVFDGMQWAKRSYFATREDQFVKSKNVWNYDPSIVWVIEAGKNMHPATEFFQACVDWVKANVQNGSAYISSYGNNDYYSGASAYQGNLDWRVSAALGQYAEGYAGKSDDEVLKALQEHTAEVFAAVLPKFYPDLAPIDGIDVTLTVQCAVYMGTTTYYNFVFKVVGTGKYEFQSFAPVE